MLVRSPRFSSLLVVSLAVAAAACGGADEGPEENLVGTAPSEARIIAGSAETKSELGIVKWGFAADDVGDLTTYRGYGAKNEVIATVVQTLDRSDPDVYHSGMTVTVKGSPSASQKIDFALQPAADGTSNVIMTVTESTFEDDSVATKVLARFKADTAGGGTTLSGGGSLLGQTRPMADGKLVGSCSGTTDKCQVELIDQRIAAAAKSGDCGLLKRVGQPLLAGVVGAGAGALATIWGGPTALVGGALGGGAAVAGAVAVSETQCLDSKRGATKANSDLKKCREDAAKSCQAPTSH